MGFPGRISFFNLNLNPGFFLVEEENDPDLLQDIVGNILNRPPAPRVQMNPEQEIQPIRPQNPVQQQPALVQVKDLISNEEVPEGAKCEMMCDVIPKGGFGVKINDQIFDVRYIIKYMLTQKEPVSPYKQTFSPNDVKIICDKMGILPQEFLDLLKEEGRDMSINHSMALVIRGTELLFQVMVQAISGERMNDGMIRDLERFEQVVAHSQEQNKEQKLFNLLDRAVRENKITQEKADTFKQAIRTRQ